MLKLTPENQTRRFIEDAERVRAGRRADFGIGDHLLMLMKRCDALEQRDRDSDERRNGEDAQRLSGEAMPARAEGIAHPHPGDIK